MSKIFEYYAYKSEKTIYDDNNTINGDRMNSARKNRIRELISIIALIFLLIVPINGLNIPVIVASERNLSIELPPNYAVIDDNATSFASITSQGMTHTYNITNISNPKSGNITFGVLSLGINSSEAASFMEGFEEMASSLIKIVGGKKIGERIAKDINGKNITVTTFEMKASSPLISYFSKNFDHAMWSIDEQNFAYLSVPSTIGKNVTNEIIGTMKL
jgi:hypothetical protein